jgi:type VI protein secretion system component Hcp
MAWGVSLCDFTILLVPPTTASERDRQPEALSDRELSNVSGGKGKATPSPFVFVHHYDKASPVL